MDNATQRAVFAGGCFWGMEELFRKLPGVIDTETGYTGGASQNPTYAHHPGDAEAIRIQFDPEKISYNGLLDFFFRIHDPSTLNRQGNDVGTSYRSAIFYATDEQKKEAQAFIALVNKSGRWKNPVTTTLEPLAKFTEAEPEHQDYLQKYPDGYTCHYVRVPSYLA
jgi:peptide-methionine (S)-S-oxide reductase